MDAVIDEDVGDQLFLVNPATPTKIKHGAFQKLARESSNLWNSSTAAGDGDVFDKIVFQDDDLYDSSQDSFRYGRVTTGPSYNLVTGKMPENIFSKVKSKDDENDVKSEADDSEDFSEIKQLEIHTFIELYESQMPKYFEYRTSFPEIRGIWTLLFDQNHYQDMSTFELQAAICAALNSRHYMMICVGVDSYNTITGVEMSAINRVTFRMALTRAVAGEFQPPLIKIAPKQLTGVTPMKRDVSELTPSVDVLFIPVTGEGKFGGDEIISNRFLIVVRVKELSKRFYQLSSGRIYKEEDGRVVEMSNLNDAFHTMINEQSISDIRQRRGSMFMLEPEPFIIDSSIVQEDVQVRKEKEASEKMEKFTEKETLVESIVSRLDFEHIGWLLFGSALSFCLYKNAVKLLVK
ncbi:hypothetical protein GCK72_002022 [Caenorhabditis remanei]|nr:hypothetical protein GCK72_002022 [Caenorhabditis remanei]KAF1770204.1 hypothetical protein GCK72_002022 [Caenorhabditis remanei]